eukprot:SAG22_NODE_68_length_22846_cov_32.458258_5_plen_146_part_00
MALTLYTYPGNPRANKALIAAQYNGVEVKIPADFVMGESNKTPEFLALNPLGKVPCLETAEGALFESNAIARYGAPPTNARPALTVPKGPAAAPGAAAKTGASGHRAAAAARHSGWGARPGPVADNCCAALCVCLCCVGSRQSPA